MARLIAATVAALAALLAGGACGGNSACEEFPLSVGFEPLEAVQGTPGLTWPDPGGPDAINVVYGPTFGHSWAHGLGYVHQPLSKVYQALKDPAASRIITPGNHWTVTSADPEPQFPISFAIHYTVYDAITVEWDILYRGGLALGTEQAPLLVGLRYQRTCGSRHIAVESGSLRAYPSDSDPSATKLEMVGWLAADRQGPPVVGGTLNDWFANLTATLASLPP
jgi:hypothetical protein